MLEGKGEAEAEWLACLPKKSKGTEILSPP